MKKFDTLITKYISEQTANSATINFQALDKAKLSPTSENQKLSEVLKNFGLNIDPSLGVPNILQAIKTLDSNKQNELEQALNKEGLTLKKLNQQEDQNQTSTTQQTQPQQTTSPTSYSAQGPKA
jgi:hypothetical protein